MSGGFPTIINSIFWGNTPTQIHGTPTVTYSDVQGAYSGTGNIDSAPLFVGSGDYHLAASSPCINTGNNDAPDLPATDKDGRPRIFDGTVDMGAYEYNPTMSASAQILQIWPVDNATCGQTSTLWAEVKNTGSSALPSNAKVWFYVDGPNWSGTNWVGSASVSGLSAGSTDWYSFDWPIPSGATSGTYTYWAQVWTDKSISDWSSAQTFDVSCGGMPGPATLISPTGIITDNTPTYSWNAVSGSTWYYLWVNDSTGNKIKQWYTAAQAGCASGGTCSVTPATTLSYGAGQWWIQTWNSNGYGPWSDPLSLTLQWLNPEKITMTSPIPIGFESIGMVTTDPMLLTGLQSSVMEIHLRPMRHESHRRV